ncbi:uncharacterized protein LOC122843839 isoform X5 [Gambusia affinis]|uniref:uncharacterized protein LOC122843839 isoform X5 n=1 Tax=Gambusia affinis TaxID=33528 RepID=UPI001CDBC033|nr:uncharacterized protein LOC122843839 isoform X5 [Gambusia affinis]
MKKARVCGAHFISGEASLDWQDPDFVPSVFMSTKQIQRPGAKMKRNQRKRGRDDTAHKSPDQPSFGSDSNTEHGPDVQQLGGIKEEESWSPKPDQEDQKSPEIKKEEEENEITKFIFNPLPVKSEDDEEKPQLSELSHSQTKENGDFYEPDRYLESDGEDKTSDSCSESSKTDVSDGNWEESSEAQAGLGSGTNNTDPVCEKGVLA